MTIMFTRLFWATAAFLNVIIGTIGAIMPLMPASPFFILSLICIKKASPEMHHYIVGTRPFMWLKEKIPVLSKWLA
ncbi:DUF454 family protein [Pediococcus stilesii]|uniref:DUF454 domain-containing protein n=1 Tax=Pediococcus stilesii TaxID=331679 RepID=A0A0R2L4L6_9LACO|nr:DUF454 family protein [Pediococcus stilesii]KRN94186.1 hypothetical protein IV81_GL001600 [Pediococcus stilesii]TLQ04467.1 DUF454 domain-containing protein [Pediococcus stilesii]